MQQQDTFRDKLIPWYFVAFFVGLIIVNVIFVSLALNSHTGVVSENSYQEGLDYNKTIDEVKKEQELGWQTVIEAKDNLLNVSLKDKEGKPLEGAKIIASMTYIKDNFTIPLEDLGNGNYKSKFEFPHKGKWDIRIVTLWQDQQFQSHTQIFLK